MKFVSFSQSYYEIKPKNICFRWRWHFLEMRLWTLHFCAEPLPGLGSRKSPRRGCPQDAQGSWIQGMFWIQRWLLFVQILQFFNLHQFYVEFHLKFFKTRVGHYLDNMMIYDCSSLIISSTYVDKLYNIWDNDIWFLLHFYDNNVKILTGFWPQAVLSQDEVSS